MIENENRKCIVTGIIKPKNDLLRFVKSKNNKIFFDSKKNIKGRGAYISKDEKTLEIMINKKLLNRNFKTNINISIYKQLHEEVKTWLKNNKENLI